MRQQNIIYGLIALALSTSLLLVSCGVKKNATAEVSSAKATQPAKTEQTETAMDIVTPGKTETAMDTLPDFLKEFANDSTIHINWAHGIPFIIDDSVPMLLPPIDKNPQGYVSRDLARIGYKRYKNQEILGLYNPMDSILWLNKCLNDAYDYIMTNMIDTNTDFTPDCNVSIIADSISNLVFDDMHRYSYVVRLLSLNNEYYFQIFFEQEQYGMQSPELANYRISYFLDIEGTLLGKMHIQRPKHWFRPREDSVIYLRTSIPDYNLFINRYFSKAKNGTLFLIFIQPFSLTGD